MQGSSQALLLLCQSAQGFPGYLRSPWTCVALSRPTIAHVLSTNSLALQQSHRSLHGVPSDRETFLQASIALITLMSRLWEVNGPRSSLLGLYDANRQRA